MSVDTLPETGVRMIIGGTIVERREFDDVLSIIASRLQSSPTASLAVGSVNLDHLYHFRKVMSAPTGPLEWLLLADGMPIAWRGQLLTGKPWPRVTGADLLPGVLALAETTGQRVGFLAVAPKPIGCLPACCGNVIQRLPFRGCGHRTPMTSNRFLSGWRRPSAPRAPIS
ncbi:hypothetical protein NIIDMKKI_11490 [Mycobacterium kansasii]|uniref:Uncharacterized protein n=1 Tax=Mycobacterium kansasii TaxID=1768 RepID=A0A7G1I6N8_MYCKA|nr:hypothetical protein NIIDMKKI_11490 [Mycobacterium kansasii]